MQLLRRWDFGVVVSICRRGSSQGRRVSLPWLDRISTSHRIVWSGGTLLCAQLICLGLLLLLHCTDSAVIQQRTQSEAATDRSKRSKDILIPAGDYHPHREMYPSDPYMEVVMKPVPVPYFTMKLHQAKSYHDVLRIFYGEYMSNDMIDSMITASSSHMLFGGMTTGVAHPGGPMGGLNDGAPFEVDRPTLEGTNHSPIGGGTCPSCDTSVIRTKRKDVIIRHSGGRRKSKRKHRRRGKKRKGKKRKGKGKNTQEMRKAMDHVDEIQEKGKCKYAVPELVRIRDISTAANRIYFPECTIVHRCKQVSGCCNESSVCGPKSTTEIKRHFYVVEIGQANYARPDRRFVQTFPFINHTECECKPLQQIPKCLGCPAPFYLRRDGTRCSCDCFDKDTNCLRIKRGRKPLSEEEIRCIKEGSCHSPNCQYGHFNQRSIRTGYCPKRNQKHTTTTPSKSEEKDKSSGDKPISEVDKSSSEVDKPTLEVANPAAEVDDEQDQVLKIGEGTLSADTGHQLNSRDDNT